MSEQRLIRPKLADIYAAAAIRPPGYVEECLRAGRVEGDHVVMELEAWARLVRRFDPEGVEARLARLASGQGCAGCGD